MAADGAVGVSDGSRGDTNGQRAQTLLQLPLPEVDGPSEKSCPSGLESVLLASTVARAAADFGCACFPVESGACDTCK